MDDDIIVSLNNEVKKLNASIDLYFEFTKLKAYSLDEKKMITMKAELVREEALRYNLKIRRLIDKMGY